MKLIDTAYWGDTDEFITQKHMFHHQIKPSLVLLDLCNTLSLKHLEKLGMEDIFLFIFIFNKEVKKSTFLRFF